MDKMHLLFTCCSGIGVTNAFELGTCSAHVGVL